MVVCGIYTCKSVSSCLGYCPTLSTCMTMLCFPGGGYYPHTVLDYHVYVADKATGYPNLTQPKFMIGLLEFFMGQ